MPKRWQPALLEGITFQNAVIIRDSCALCIGFVLLIKYGKHCFALVSTIAHAYQVTHCVHVTATYRSSKSDQMYSLSWLMCSNGKGHPVTCVYWHRGQAARGIAPTHSSASVPERGGWSAQSCVHFTTGKDSVPIVPEAEWVWGPVWTARDLIPGPSSPQRAAIPTTRSRPPMFIN